MKIGMTVVHTNNGVGSAPAHRIVITRSGDRASELVDQLAACGHVPICVPINCIQPPSDDTRLRQALVELETYDWLVLTSINAVDSVAERRAPPWPDHVRVAVVGAATRAAVERHGGTVHLVPAQQSGGGLVRELAPRLGDATVLLPQSAIALMTVRQGLLRAGARVDAVEAYRTEVDHRNVARLRALILTGDANVIIFCSPSAARALAGGDDRGLLARLLQEIVVVSIGATTTAALDQLGRSPDTQARSPDTDDVMHAVLEATARVPGRDP